MSRMGNLHMMHRWK